MTRARTTTKTTRTIADRAASRRELPPLLAGLALVIMTFVTYLPVLDAGFIWDDDDYLTANPLIVEPGGLAPIWTPGATRQYYPLVFTTFWVEHRLWGLDPTGYHLVNVALHALAVVVLWRLARRLAIPGAWVVAAVFAVHPVHVESVAWITERKNVLSGALYLLAALAYLRFDHPSADDDGGSPRGAVLAYILALVLFALALLSKSVTCSLPAALLLVAYLRRLPLSAVRVAWLLPFFAIGAVAALHTAHLERASVGAVGAAFDRPFAERVAVAARALLFYPTKLLAPWPVMFVYPRWAIDVRTVAAWWPAAVVAVVAGLAVVAARRGRRGPFVALAFFAGTVFPALGFFNVYPHQFSFVADHFQYLASIGIIALVAASAARWLPPRLRVATAAAVLTALALLAMDQARSYASAEDVWRDTLRKNDTAWLAHNNLSTILLRRADAAGPTDADGAARLASEAADHAARAAELHPGYHLAHANRSEALRLLGRPEEALLEQRRALDLVLAELEASGTSTSPRWLAQSWYQLGRLLQRLDRAAEAADAYEAALAIDAGRDDVRAALAPLLVRLDRLDEAERAFERLLASAESGSAPGEGAPGRAALLGTLGAIAERRGDHAEADRRLIRALAAAPTLREEVELTVRRIRLLASAPAPHRDLDAATALAAGLVERSQRRDPAALDVLASVQASAGRWAEAEAIAAEAIETARRLGMNAMADDIARRLEGYRRREPSLPGPSG